jgi:hypothetical protein
MERLLSSNEFEEVFKTLNKFQRQEVYTYVYGNNIDMVKLVCERFVQKDLGEMSIQELRKLAKKLSIPYYTKYPKSQLLILVAQRKLCLPT